MPIFHRPFRALALVCTLIGSLLSPGARAQVVPNSSFEANTYTVFPGYMSANGGVITGWQATPATSVGLNPGGGSPFADNGAIPDGLNVAFLQNNPAAGGSFLETDISGLTIGVTYKVTVRINGRGSNNPALQVFTHAVGDLSRLPLSTAVRVNVIPVGGAEPYRYFSYEFKAAAASQTLTLNNPSESGDQTVLVDDIKVAPSSGAWRFSPWDDDASSGLNNGYLYTHAYTFGGSAISAVANGVGFLAAPGGNPSVADRFSTGGMPNSFGDVNRVLAGGSNGVGKSFIYGGPSQSITLVGLKPNTAYVATIFGVAFDAKPTSRAATFSSSVSPDDRLTVDLDQYGQTRGIRVEYAYTSDATGSVTLSYNQTSDGSWHTSAFCNRETVSRAFTQNAWSGDSTSGVDGALTYTHAYHFGSSAAALINGVTFTGVDGANPAAANFTTTNLGAVFNNDDNNLTAAGGGSAILARNFVYNGFPGIIQLTGLTPGQTYRLSIFSVGWEATGVRQATFGGANGTLLVDQNIYGDNNGIRIDYRYVADASGSVTVTTSPAATNSIHTYGFCNRVDTALGTSPWSFTAWTDNSNTAVNSDAVYTHAYNFGSPVSPVINGVTFTGIGVGNPSAANFSTANLAPVFNGDANNVTGTGAGMASDFVYGGSPGLLALSGLTPGKEYLLSLFSVGFEGVGGRRLMFTGPDGTRLIDQDAFDNNNGIRIDYRYVADATGKLRVTTAPQTAGSTFHLYGFANREFAFNARLQILSQPESAYVTALGGPVSFNVFADGAQPLSYQWRKGNTNIAGATGTTYTIPSVSAADIGTYTVVVTGSAGQGSVTSNGATIILATDPVPGLFSTGVGVDGSALPDGASDPHYILRVNADGGSVIPAIVESSTEFPIVTGPWLANSATSKWVGPRLNTAAAGALWIVAPNPAAAPPVEGVPNDAGAGPGTYVYRTTVDLTGFNLSSVRLTGSWSSDNQGVAIKVNDVATNLSGPGNFGAFTQFSLTSANSTFRTGINTIDFVVTNADVLAGYTGLRVDNFQGFGTIAPNTKPYIAVQPVNAAVPKFSVGALAVGASGSAELTYQWYKGNVLLTGETTRTLVAFFDSPAPAGTYTVKVTNGSGTTTSLPATLSVANASPVTVTDGAVIAKNATASFLSDALLANDSDADQDSFFVTGVSPTSTAAGTVTLSFGTVTYKPALNFTGTDSFTYTVDDGWGGIATGTVQVAVLSGPIPAQGQLLFSALPDLKKLRFSGVPGTSYTFQRSEDLKTWQDISTVTAPPTTILDFVDPTPGTALKAFFRIRQN